MTLGKDLSPQAPAEKWVVSNATDVATSSGRHVADCWTHANFSREACQEHARLIAAAPELLDWVKLFERSLVYEIAKSQKAGDDEGARLKTVTLNLVRATIAKAEGGA